MGAWGHQAVVLSLELCFSIKSIIIYIYICVYYVMVNGDVHIKFAFLSTMMPSEHTTEHLVQASEFTDVWQFHPDNT